MQNNEEQLKFSAEKETPGGDTKPDWNLENLPSPVLIIGSGLLGVSIGLGLVPQGVEVYLRDISPTALALAEDMRAGRKLEKNQQIDPQLVIVAAPPDVCVQIIAAALAEFPNAIVTDVASVKTRILNGLQEQGVDLSRYLGSHPMAGRERSGAAFARADLFAGRPWVLCPHAQSRTDALNQLKQLVIRLGALPYEMPVEGHDQAVALVSHLPQLLSSALAARLSQAQIEALGLAGQGLRDMTRIASSDARLWAAIIGANTEPIAKLIGEIIADLEELQKALENCGQQPHAPAVVGTVTRLIQQGNQGVSRIPGKHGGAPRRYAELMVIVPDTAGALAKLFEDVGGENVNIEDLALEHSPGAAYGIARLFIEPKAVNPLVEALLLKGWRITSG